MSAPGLDAHAAYISRTIAIPDPGDLVDLLPTGSPTSALSWIQGGDGFIGWGEVARLVGHGAHRFAQADAAWAQFSRQCAIDDEVRRAGTGPIAFGSFAFSPASSAGGVLIVPEVVVGRRDGVSWLTITAAAQGDLVTDLDAYRSQVAPLGPGTRATFRAGVLDQSQWHDAVATVIDTIRSGDVAKVVMARDLLADLDGPADIRRTLSHLTRSYETSWTFAVDGFIGATPELLIRRERGQLSSRVLAGTIERTGDPRTDAGHAAALAASAKDLDEHAYAVNSLTDSLADVVASTSAARSPFVLQLPNVMHLATDVTASLAPDCAGMSSLAVAARAHPTAAVCGTPTAAAARILAAHEGIDRHRYAGPVGWLGADGDGEWGIGLRSARALAPDRWQLFAGCGIMSDSDPEEEWAESEAKLAPMRSAISAS